MRITSQMIGASAQSSVSSALARLVQTGNQASSGKRILRASDDPLGTGQALGYRSALADIGQYTKNAKAAKLQLGIADTGLSDVNKAITAAKTVGLQGANATTSDDGRAALAVQVQNQIDNIVKAMNTTNLDQHSFGGYRTDIDPVTANPAGTPPYLYNGDDGEVTIALNDSSSVTVNVTAKQVLGFGNAGSPDVLTTLTNLKNALTSNDQAAIQSSLKELDAASQNVITLRGVVGARASQVEVHISRLSETESTVRDQLSEVEDVDITQVITQLQTEQNTYQAALIATSRMTQRSLADYLS